MSASYNNSKHLVDRSWSMFVFLLICILSMLYLKPVWLLMWTALYVFILLISLSNKRKGISRESNQDLKWLKSQDPKAQIRVKDKGSQEDLGSMEVRHVLFLALQFQKNDMPTDAFYFDAITFDFFKQEFGNQGELIDVIEGWLKGRDEIEVEWEKRRGS
ncbi:hypothetical protein QLX67_09540 [Balneolaceae bacterium ANBcel3]|nr:hypothetical protein [Balneolaceae bacterium ANBcel3]